LRQLINFVAKSYKIICLGSGCNATTPGGLYYKHIMIVMSDACTISVL
jgi:hypothetical protein